MKKFLVFISAFFVILNIYCNTNADEPIVRDFSQEYVTKSVTAKNVKGVEIKLTKEISRNDCNRISMSMESARVSGDGDGWYDKYIMDASIRSTLMFCPLKEPVKETVSSKPIFIKSFTNENVKGEVIVTIIIPKGYNLEAKAVR